MSIEDAIPIPNCRRDKIKLLLKSLMDEFFLARGLLGFFLVILVMILTSKGDFFVDFGTEREDGVTNPVLPRD